jgi:hypothetical protein
MLDPDKEIPADSTFKDLMPKEVILSGRLCYDG